MGETALENGETTQKPPSDAKLYLGQNGPSIWREGMEIGNPVRESLSE
jgi:actin-like protein 6A